MTATRDLLNAGLSLQAAALAGKNLDFAMKKKKSSKGFLKMGVTNIVGTSLIGSQANLIGAID